MYDNNRVTNDYIKGVRSKTEIWAAHTERSCPETVPLLRAEMIASSKSPLWVAPGGKRAEHFLDRCKFTALVASFRSHRKRAAITIDTSHKSVYTPTVAFEAFDPVGM